MSKSKVLFIFSGSVACYKAAGVVSKMVQLGYDVQCVLTAAAEKFIGKATLEGLTGKKVYSDLFEEDTVMGHIQLIRAADMVVLAPATANIINKMASGIADDLASTLFLAHDFKKPFLVVPAMNTAMYEHPVTQASIAKLKDLGVKITSTGSGILACGEVGYGKMLEPEQILNEILMLLQKSSGAEALNIKADKSLLITGGGTVEPIDSVRFIMNVSTGATAVKMAAYFRELGFTVTLLLSTNYQHELIAGVKILRFTTFEDLNHTLKMELRNHSYDYFIHAAAVSDFSVKEVRAKNRKINPTGKIESSAEVEVVLQPNFKIISKIHEYSRNKKIKIVGFKLTDTASTQKRIQAIDKLLDHPNVEFVVHNDLRDISKDKSQHRFQLIAKKNRKYNLLSGVTELNKAILKQVILGGQNDLSS